MFKFIRAFSDTFALLLGLNPKQRVLGIILAAVAVVSLNWFADAVLTLLTGQVLWNRQFALSLLSLPAVVLLFYLLTRRAATRSHDAEHSLIDSRPPPSCQGLIVMLSTFTTFANKLPPGRRNEIWRSDDLLAALQRTKPDWQQILDHVQASNMQTPLEAIRHHADSGTLRHVWILTTPDTEDPTGVTRPGSHHIAAAFARIVRELYPSGLQLHYGTPELSILPYNVQSAFESVNRIFTEAAPRLNLTEADLIGDITSGTVLMSSGVLLACALLQRKVQFTAANAEPIHGAPLERPKSYALRTNDVLLQRLTLQRLLTVDEGS